MIPLRTDSRLHATPWMNWALDAANVAAFMVQRAFDLDRAPPRDLAN